MHIQFLRHPSLPPGAPEPQWPQGDLFTLVALQRDADPDATEHTGYDYLGAYGDQSAIEEWAEDQNIELVGAELLPNPVSFYPTPFNQQ